MVHWGEEIQRLNEGWGATSCCYLNHTLRVSFYLANLCLVKRKQKTTKENLWQQWRVHMKNADIESPTFLSTYTMTYSLNGSLLNIRWGTFKIACNGLFLKWILNLMVLSSNRAIMGTTCPKG